MEKESNYFISCEVFKEYFDLLLKGKTKNGPDISRVLRIVKAHLCMCEECFNNVKSENPELSNVTHRRYREANIKAVKEEFDDFAEFLLECVEEDPEFLFAIGSDPEEARKSANIIKHHLHEWWLD